MVLIHEYRPPKILKKEVSFLLAVKENVLIPMKSKTELHDYVYLQVGNCIPVLIEGQVKGNASDFP